MTSLLHAHASPLPASGSLKENGPGQQGPEPSPLRSLPPLIDQRLRDWHGLWWRSAAYHYVLGIAGVTASTLAALSIPYLTPAAGVVSAVCFAIIGFVRPGRRYLKFARAWRILDSVAVRYRLLNGSDESLVAAVERGEEIITGFETQEALPRAEDESLKSSARKKR